MATATTKPKALAPSQKIKVRIKKLHEDAVVPEVKTTGSAGMDLHVIEDVRLAPTTTTEQAYMVRSGLAMAIPEGYHGKVFLRSSTGKKHKLRLANGTGIIDSDYRGEVMFLVENVGALSTNIYKGDRLFQIIIEKNEDVEVSVVDELDETKRGAGGMGSTGNGKGQTKEEENTEEEKK